MKKSESIKELAVALMKFQGEIENPKNTAINPYFSSKYAPLSEVLKVARPILSKFGLSIVQAPSTADGNIIITTILMHESGEWIEPEPLALKMDKVTAQGAGSAITYARRYALSSILGISSEDDDDGNHAEDTTEVNKNVKDKKPATSDNLATDSQLKLMYRLANEKNYVEGVKSYIKNAYKKDSDIELTKTEASEMIGMLQSLGK